jgi:hypothetical protein
MRLLLFESNRRRVPQPPPPDMQPSFQLIRPDGLAELAAPSPKLVRADTVDWQRAEDIRDAIAAHVGLPSCKLRPYRASTILR